MPRTSHKTLATYLDRFEPYASIGRTIERYVKPHNFSIWILPHLVLMADTLVDLTLIQSPDSDAVLYVHQILELLRMEKHHSYALTSWDLCAATLTLGLEHSGFKLESERIEIYLSILGSKIYRYFERGSKRRSVYDK